MTLPSLEGPPQHPGHTLPPRHHATSGSRCSCQTALGHHSQDHALPPPPGPSAETGPTECPLVPNDHIFLVIQNTLLRDLFSPHGAWARLQSRLPCMSPPEMGSGPGLIPRYASLLSCDFKKIYGPHRVTSGLDPALRLRSHLHMEPQTVGTSQRIESTCPLLPHPHHLRTEAEYRSC